VFEEEGRPPRRRRVEQIVTRESEKALRQAEKARKKIWAIAIKTELSKAHKQVLPRRRPDSSRKALCKEIEKEYKRRVARSVKYTKDANVRAKKISREVCLITQAHCKQSQY
jgi:hypothetical protein